MTKTTTTIVTEKFNEKGILIERITETTFEDSDYTYSPYATGGYTSKNFINGRLGTVDGIPPKPKNAELKVEVGR